MGTMKKWIIGLLVLGALVWAGVKFWPGRKAAAPVYETVTVERGDLERSVQASGEVKPQNRVELKPPFSGRLEEVLVREGDWVKRGQVLAWLSSSERAALLDAARARGPEELKKWEERYRPTPLLSPISGTLIARSFEPGQGVGPSDAVLTVSDRLIVKAAVDETDIARVKNGGEARLTLDAYASEPFDAKVVHIAYEARTTNNVTVYEVEVAPLKAPAFMRSGMTASVDFIAERRTGVLTIPNDAIQPRKERAEGNAMAGAVERAARNSGKPRREGPREGGRRATVLQPGATKDAAPIEKEVRLGFSDGKNTEVVEGLKEGDQVLVASAVLPSAAAAGKNPFMPQRGGGGRPPRGAR
jgi:macrolide-specific efflux system membrane fusion protein